MDQRDLDAYTLAKRQQKRVRLGTYLALGIGVASLILVLAGFANPVVFSALVGSILGAVLANSEVLLFGTAVSRRALFDIIENQINRDPDAIAYLAKKPKV